MGNGMNKIITGVYVGNIRDAKDREKLNEYKITHILSIHDYAQAIHEDKTYLCIKASDTPHQTLTQFFPQCIDFIHKARLERGNVLIHCLAGVSRSVTVTAAYIMTATDLGWRDSLNAIRGARSAANPNFGFQKQLQTYESEGLQKARQEFKEKYPESDFNDEEECKVLLKSYNNYLMTGENRTPPELYSLPHKAYGDRNKDKTETDKDDTDSECGKQDNGDTKTETKDSNNEKSVNDIEAITHTDEKGVTNSLFSSDDEKS